MFAAFPLERIVKLRKEGLRQPLIKEYKEGL